MKKTAILCSAIAWLMAMPAMADDTFTENGVTYTKDGDIAKVTAAAEATGEVVIRGQVTIDENDYYVTVINTEAFQNNTAITKVTIPNDISLLCEKAFQGCTGLTEVVFQEYEGRGGITELYQYMFDGCTSLTKVNIPEGVTKIHNQAFNGCSSLTFLSLPASCEEIGWYAFYGCSALSTLTIPAAMNKFEEGLFSNCSNLKSIYYLGNTLTLAPTEDAWKIFQETNNPVIYTKSSALSAVKAALDGKADWIKDLVTDDIPFTQTKDYTTFCSDFDVDFSAADGLQAGVALADAYTDGQLTLSVKEAVPAHTGMLLKGTAGEHYTLKIAESGPEAVEGSLLKGVVLPTAIPQAEDDQTNFVLHDGVFRKVAATGVLPAGRAYLQLPTPVSSEVRSVTIYFEGAATGVVEVKREEVKREESVFNLSGQQVGKPAQGIYIVNGKKMMAK